VHRTRNLISLALLCLVALGCEAEPPEELGGSPGVRRVDRFEAPEDDRNLTAGERASRAGLEGELTRFHGQRPRKYNGLLNGNVESEQCFAGAITAVTAYVNARLAARGFNERVDEYELATNFITEGGYFPLYGNRLTGIDGFGELGVDTLVSNYAALKPFLHEDVRRLVDGGNQTVELVNENGETVFTLEDMNIEEGLYANAGMYVYERANVASDMANPALLQRWCRRKGKTANAAIVATDMATLPQWQQFFWTTVYYNAGAGRGRQFLCQHWLPWASQSYDGADNNRAAKFNAAWRTSTYRYMAGTAGPSVSSYCERKNGAACVCDRCNLQGDCSECVGADACGWCTSGDYGQCTSSAAGCIGHITDAAECPVAPEPLPPRSCADAVSCMDCFLGSNESCGWCGSSNSCMIGHSQEDGPDEGSCDDWYFDLCPQGPCSADFCSDCPAESGCGYCSTSDSCAVGSAEGPSAGTCPDWVFGASANYCGGDMPVDGGVSDGGVSDGGVSDGGVSDGGVLDSGTTECASPSSFCIEDFECCDDEVSGGLGRCIATACATCQPGEGGISAPCDPAVSTSCCGLSICSPVADLADLRCCLDPDLDCSFNTDCCGAMRCDGGRCQCQTSGQPCLKARECCGASICTDGVCS